MIEQEITILLDEQDPFSTKTVNVMVPKGTKIISKEPYTLDMLDFYGLAFDNSQITKAQEQKGTKLGKGIVISMEGETALIDMGGKYTGYCQLGSEKKNVVDELEVGMEVDVKYKKQGEGQVIASISDAIDDMKEQEIVNSIGDTTVAFTGIVKELIHGGYWVDLSGVKCFMPGSLAGMNKLWDFNAPVGKELLFMPINYLKDKETVVVSHREYLKTILPHKVRERRANLKEKITGYVTGTTKFGIFVEFDECLTGMIPKENLVELEEDYKNNKIKPGTEVEFWVNDIIHDKKITLTQTGPVYNPWDGAESIFVPMSAHTGKVIKITKYGAFVELADDIVGLIHISNLQDEPPLNVGELVDIRVRSISPAERRISLALSTSFLK
tara:strand:- start:5803 stop:6954 length:1152 start_codon:yes stop_codon:yes gene_type:complete